MSEAKHTPGPWKAEGLSVVVDTGKGYVHVASAMNRIEDAKLISAAPDLLAACEAALPLLFLLGAKMPGEKQIGETFEIVKDAIRKARGQ